MMRVSEVIRGWLGWCPGGHTMNVQRSGDTGSGFPAPGLLAKNPGPSGADRPGIPWGGRYEHTQRGTLIIGAVSAAIILILVCSYLSGIEWIAIIVLGIMVFVLAIMSSLTVSITDGFLRIRFGPVGLVRKSWPVAEIVSVATVTNPWYYGYGLRWTPQGRLYNVSGRGAVEVLLFSGKKFRIGTDEPEALKTAIETARAEMTNHSRETGHP